MTEQRALTRPQLITQLTKSPHGDLGAYEDVGRRAARDEAEFFAHLIAWNAVKGTIRDSKVALPVLALTGTLDRELMENALAHLAQLRPRDFLRALDFAKTIKAPDRLMRRLVSRYVADLEARPDWPDVSIRHRKPLATLHKRFHFKMPEINAAALGALRTLHLQNPQSAAFCIREFALPFLSARGACEIPRPDGTKLCDVPEVLVALIERMSPTEVQSNAKWIENRPCHMDAAVQAALHGAVRKTGKSTATPLKATKAAEAVVDKSTQQALTAAQEASLNKLGSIEGRWLVLVDKSGSMQDGIGLGREIAAMLARMCPEVHLVFFDTAPRVEEVAGMTLEQIQQKTRHVTAGGGTDISCGITYALDKGWEIDAIAVVSDGQDNHHGKFTRAYNRLDGAPPVYFYKIGANASGDTFSGECHTNGIDVQVFDMRDGTDAYALPTLVQTMRAKRYALADEVMAMPLLTLDGVLKETKGRAVFALAPNVLTVTS